MLARKYSYGAQAHPPATKEHRKNHGQQEDTAERHNVAEAMDIAMLQNHGHVGACGHQRRCERCRHVGGGARLPSRLARHPADMPTIQSTGRYPNKISRRRLSTSALTICPESNRWTPNRQERSGRRAPERQPESTAAGWPRRPAAAVTDEESGEETRSPAWRTRAITAAQIPGGRPRRRRPDRTAAGLTIAGPRNSSTG